MKNTTTTAQHIDNIGNETIERNSNLELFRIITMLLIVAHHYVVNSGLYGDSGPIFADPMSWKSMFLNVFGAFGKTGINCFVLITGYFMCTSQITARKFFKLILEIEFYNILIWLVFFLSGYEPFSLKGFIEMLLPIKGIATGFTSCYLVFFLFIPFLNILIKNLSEAQHVKLLLLCIFTYVVMGTLPGFDVTMNYLSWFIVLYIIGSYMRIYDKKVFSNTRFWGWSTLAMLIVSILSVPVMTWIGVLLGKEWLLSYFFLSDSNKVLAVILAVCAFMFFKNLNMRSNKIINTISASTFGVLMIHANSGTMRRWLWKDTLKNVEMYQSDWMPLHAIGSVFMVFIVCVTLDYLRIRYIEKYLLGAWMTGWDRMVSWHKKRNVNN